jgi:hypothetical protein
MRAIGIHGPPPLSRPVVDIDRLDLNCQTAEQATLPLLATVAHGISPSRIRFSGRPIALQRLMSMIARDARPARSWFDPRAACSMA